MASSRQSLAGIGSKANSRASLAPGRASLAPPKHGRQSLAPGQQAAMDRRKSSIASGMGRRSSVAPGASGRKPADPRQITDKAFKERSIRKLIEYLVEHGYERTLSPQLLTAPQTKDFVFIVSFLLRAAIPNFKFDAKFEDELPAVLKSLGYPYTISQSALKSVGAPHAWPTLLAALAWLVDLLNYSEAEAARRETGEAGFDGEEDGYSKMFLDYLARGYALFLSGEDDLSALDEEIAFTFESKNASFTTDIASLTTANAELSTQLATLTDGDTPLQKAQAHNRDLQSDTAKFEKHIADLHGHRSKVQEKLEGEKKKLALRQEELRTVQAEVLQSKETIARQDLTPADVRRMHSERDHLESELASTKAQKDALSAQLWDEEVAVSRSLERLEDKIQRLNNCSLRLHLIPAEAKNARGASHEVFLNPKKLANEPEGLLSVEPSAVLVPGLQRVKAGFSAELSAAQDALLECEEEGTRREEQGHERSDELARLKAELGKLEREEKRLREEHAKELADRKAETDRLEESLQSAKSANGQSVVASQSELAALQKELDEFTEDAAKKREKMYLHLVSSLDMLALHKENVEKQLASLKQHCAAKMEMLQPLLVDEVVDLE